MSRRRHAQADAHGAGFAGGRYLVWHGKAACCMSMRVCALKWHRLWAQKGHLSSLPSFPLLRSCRWRPKMHVTRASPDSARPATAAGPLALVRAAFQSDIARHRLPRHHNGLTAFLWPELEQEGRLMRSRRTIEG